MNEVMGFVAYIRQEFSRLLRILFSLNICFMFAKGGDLLEPRMEESRPRILPSQLTAVW